MLPPRSHVRVASHHCDLSWPDKQAQDPRAIKSDHDRRVEVYWNDLISLVLQVGRVSSVSYATWLLLSDQVFLLHNLMLRTFHRHEFEWKREECYLIRKPDPPVLVAITKVTPGRLKTSSVQLLDYNLNRFVADFCGRLALD
jgi:hypothetical protein